MRKTKILKLFLIILCLIIIICVGRVIINKFAYTNERADINRYFENPSDDDFLVLINSNESVEKGIVIDGNLYLSLDYTKENLNSRFYYDIGTNSLLYTIPTETINFHANSNTYYIDGKAYNNDYSPFLFKDDKAYVAIDLIEKFTNISYEYFTSPNRMQIYTAPQTINTVKAKKDTSLRVLGGNKSKILKDVKKDEVLELLEHGRPWSKVHSKDGYTGYVLTKCLTKSVETEVSTTYEELDYKKISLENDINLCFHQTLSQDANDLIQDQLVAGDNINVVCPTWFFIEDVSGTLHSNVSNEYIDYAHSLEVDVWPVLNDFDAASITGGINSSEESLTVLKSSSARSNIINQIISMYNVYHFDGINIDLENISEECGIHYIQFIRELSIATHQNNIVLSVDNYVPTYTKQYNRSEESVMCDYIVLMGYDENGGHSNSPGPNASVDFVEQGINDTLDEGVTKDQLILALPLYTQVWKVARDGSFEIDAVDMSQAEEYKNSYDISWIDDIGYNYTEFNIDELSYKIWIEDEKSLSLKKDLISKYNLKGTGYWKLGLESTNYFK